MDDILALNAAKGFKIVQLNCRSIYGKIDEIRHLYENVDFLSCSETWLTDRIPDHMISIRDMELFRWYRHNGYCNGVSKYRGGGVACYVNNKLNLDCQIMNDLTLTNNDIELLSLKCVYSYGKKIYVMSLYRPPDGSIENFFNILNNLLDQYSLGNNELWLMGDFNIDFLKRQDQKTMRLFEFLRLNGLKQHVLVPTRTTGFGKSCIDFIISNVDNELIRSCGTLNDVISDHFPVYICIKKERTKPEHTKVKGRTYSKYDKAVLQNLLKSENWQPFYELTDPNELWDNILNKIRKHVDIMRPIKYIRIRNDSPPWITQDVLEMINDRSASFKIAKTSGLHEDLKNARRIRNETNTFIKFSKSKYLREILEQNKDNPKKFWILLNNTLLKGHTDSSNITFDMGNGQYTSIDGACGYMNDHFANVGQHLHDQFKDTVTLDPFVDLYDFERVDDEVAIIEEDVISVIKCINVHKGSGIEYLPTFILKDCFEIMVSQITYMFNQSLALGLFLDSWATAIITPIPKSGVRSLVNNWRPISIIPLIGKLLEKLCISMLNNHLDINNILCDEQYGFRPKRSTSLAIFTYVKNITEEINKKKLVGSIYLDFAKAFDSVNHNILLEKLSKMGVSQKLLNWIKSYLKNRKICSKLNNSISEPRELLCGVPQGSILGPTLFLCYINDLAKTIKDCGACIGLFADDAVIYCSNYDQFFVKTRLEQMLVEIQKWCTLNCINMNIDKTKFCLYGNRKIVATFNDQTIGAENCQISQCHQYNYLGVTLDECLNMKANFNSILKKFSYKIYQFGKIRKYIDISTRVLLYKQTVLPLVEYVSFMLCLSNKHETDKLQRLQNRCLRMCYNVNVPTDVGTAQLHNNARLDKLCVRRDIALLSIMFDLRWNNMYEKKVIRATRANQGYIFDLNVPHTGLYANSPYYVGGNMWNKLSVKLQNNDRKDQFKKDVKDLLNNL